MSVSHFPKAKQMALPTELQNRTGSNDSEAQRMTSVLDTGSIHSSRSFPGYILNSKCHTAGSTGGTGSAKSSISQSKAKKFSLEKSGETHTESLKPRNASPAMTSSGIRTVPKMEGLHISKDIGDNPVKISSKPTLASVDGNWVIQDNSTKEKKSTSSGAADNTKPKLANGDKNNNNFLSGGVYYNEEGRLVGAPIRKSLSGNNSGHFPTKNSNVIPLSKPLPKGAASVLVDPALYRNYADVPPLPKTAHSENSSVISSMPSSPVNTEKQEESKQYRSTDDYTEAQKEEYEARTVVRANVGLVQNGMALGMSHQAVNGYALEPRAVIQQRPLYSDSAPIQNPVQVQTMLRPLRPNLPVRMIRAPTQRVFVRHPTSKQYQNVVQQRGVHVVHPQSVLHVAGQSASPGIPFVSHNKKRGHFLARAPVKHSMRVVVPPRTPPSPTSHGSVMSAVPRNFHSVVTVPPVIIPEEPMFHTIPRQRTQSVDELDMSSVYQGQTVSVQVPSYSQNESNILLSSEALVNAKKNFHSDPNLLQDNEYKHDDLYCQIPFHQMPRIEAQIEEKASPNASVLSELGQALPDDILKQDSKQQNARIHTSDK